MTDPLGSEPASIAASMPAVRPKGTSAAVKACPCHLHELDLFMAKMRAGFERGTGRQRHVLYQQLMRRIGRLRRRIDALRAKGAEESEVTPLFKRITALDEERRKYPSLDPMDPNFRRLRYCRYADDFLIGLIGSKRDAREVMDAVQDFLATSLNLRVSPEKSGIHHASTGSRFLGYHVCTDASRQTTVMAERSGRDGGTRRVPLRPLTGNVQLRVPRDRVVAFCGRNRYGDLQSRLSRARPWLIHASDLEIVEAYNAELRGFSTYYALAAGVKRSLGLLAYMATHSLMRTLARRHRSSVAKIARKLRAGSDLVVREEGRSRKVWLLKHLDLSPPAPVRVGPAGAPLGARDRARPLRR